MSSPYRDFIGKPTETTPQLDGNPNISRLLSLEDKCFLRSRGIIESVNNILKNHQQIEHNRHRSIWNFLSNLMSGLVAYCIYPNKARLFFSKNELKKLTVC